MKYLLLLALTASVATAQVPSGQPIPKPPSPPDAPAPTGELAPYDRLGKANLVVKGRHLSGGSKIDTTWRNGWGSYDRDVTSEKLMEVEIAGLNKSKGPVTVELYFAMRGSSGGLRYFKGEEMGAQADMGKWLFATSVTRNEQNYVFCGERFTRGDKIVGWLVRAIRDNVIVGIAASGPAHEKVAVSPEELAANLAGN